MTPWSGEELSELEARQEPRLVKALEMVAPGTAVREGIDNIVHARTGGLIVIGDPDELAFLFSGGIRLDILESPYRSLMEPLLEYIDQCQAANPRDYVTVILPEFVPKRWWQHLLHNQRALLIKGALLFRPRVVVTSVPFHLER